MKIILGICALMIFAAVLTYAQSHPVSTASDNNPTQNDDTPRHDFGWIGLIGLAGLAGLRRAKSEDAGRLEATGINVKTVKTN